MGLMNYGEVIDYIIDKDHLTYKSIAGVLLPNVLQALPVSLSQTIRHFAEHLEQSLAGALINAPPNLAVVKLIGMEALKDATDLFSSRQKICTVIKQASCFESLDASS